ncbi:MAG: hypothetical protein JXR94_01120, partial [Candidatus Hydrogenedentes bacterium]|nr:hypothetical protein [Candidatus Hydrogenedentota bacterium]
MNNDKPSRENPFTHPTFQLAALAIGTAAVVAVLLILPQGGQPGPGAQPGAQDVQPAPAVQAADVSPGESPAPQPPPPAPEPAAEAPPEEKSAVPPPPAGGYVNVAGTVPLPGHTLENQIVVFFDEAIRWESVEGGTPPIVFEPALVGAFETGANFVAFRLTEKPPARLIEARLAGWIESVRGAPLNPERRPFTVAPFAFRPTRLWTIEDKAERTVIGIQFPTAVELDALERHLWIKASAESAAPGSPVAFTVEPCTTTAGEASLTSFRLEVAGNDAWPVDIGFTEGLRDASGALALAWAPGSTLRYPPDALGVRDVTWGEFRPDFQELRLRFSKPVRPDALAEYLTI